MMLDINADNRPSVKDLFKIP